METRIPEEAKENDSLLPFSHISLIQTQNNQSSTSRILESLEYDYNFMTDRRLRRNPSSNLMLRRTRAGRRNYLDDNNSESNNGESADNLDEYVDFRHYPISLNWSEIDDENSEAYEILKKNGNFGLALYSSFKGKDVNIYFNSDDFVTQLLEYYLQNYSKEVSISIESLNSLITSFPKLDDIKSVINQGLFTQKEHILIKVVLDMYFHYYELVEFPNFSTIKLKILPIIFNFYCHLSIKEVEIMFNTIVSNRKLLKLFKKEEKFLIFRNKRSYIKEYNKIKEDLIRFTNGNENNFFH